MMQTITSGSCLPGKSLDMGSSDIQKSWVFQGVLFSLLMNNCMVWDPTFQPGTKPYSEKEESCAIYNVFP